MMARLGVLVPSSNTVLEPVLASMLRDLRGVSLHVARFRVTEITLDDSANAQFDDAPILAAAELLSHARTDIIIWCGTAASWLGFERDTTLCERITAATDIPACTSILALNALLARQGVHQLGLVTPYIDAVQTRIIANYAGMGIACPVQRHLGLTDNFSFATTPRPLLETMLRDVAAEKPDAIAIICTNLAGAPLVADLEREFGVPVYDSVAVALWQALAILNIDAASLAAWGGPFVRGSEAARV